MLQTGKYAISGCNDKKVRIYDLEDIEADPQIIEMPAQPQVSSTPHTCYVIFSILTTVACSAFASLQTMHKL